VTESENHPGWGRGRRLDKTMNRYIHDETGNVYVKTPDDYGGNFTMQKTSVVEPAFAVPQLIDSGWHEPYVGADFKTRERQSCAVLPTSPFNMPFPKSVRSTDAELAALGTTAIARCSPNNNVADMATALLETYHDGLPHILGHAFWESRSGRIRDVHRSLGDEYLNVQFGWQPLLGDVHDFLHGVTRLSDIYEQYAKNSGKVVRRRYDFPSISSEVETTFIPLAGATMVGNASSKWYYLNQLNYFGKVYRNRRIDIRRWFSGAFTYYVPPLEDSFVDHSNRAIETLGLDLNPETLWEIAPWSWAVDWFSNVGDLIHNANSWSTDGLVLKYGYIMEHSVVRDTYTWSGYSGLLPLGTYPQRVVLECETKLRRRATPFGFGLSGGLTNRQKAIAAALGLTRV